jgi:putative ABC transport system ATP-binding protein
MTASTALITLQGIAKVYPMPGEEVHALRSISLEINRGEFVAIVGSSGSGKSTLLYLLGLLTDPSSGSYCLGERDVGELSDRERSALRAREFGFVFQAFHLLPQLSVLDNVLLASRYATNGAVAEAPREARDLLDRVGLSHRLQHRPRELSGGEMQRVAIARALLSGPSVILADEPTGNLDDTHGGQIFDLLGELATEGKTVIVVTHDLGLASRTQRRVQLKDGEVAHDAARTA